MEWRPCPTFPDYEVSEQGDLRRLTAGRGARAGHVLRPQMRPDGYAAYMPRRDGQTLHVRRHQLVAWAFLGPPPFPSAEVAHNDGSRTNDHYSNLRWDSRRGNHADKLRHGTHSRGERHPGHKLTEAQVAAIRLSTLPQAVLAAAYGVMQPCISRIRARRRWE